MTKSISKADCSIIVRAVKQAARISKNIHDIKLTPDVKKAMAKFLANQNLNGNQIFVVFTKDAQLEKHITTKIKTSDYILHLSFGRNNNLNQYSNLLVVYIEKTSLSKFKTFWMHRCLPITLLEDITKCIDPIAPNQVLYIDVLNNTDAWYKEQMEDYKKVQDNYFIKETTDMNNNRVIYLGYYVPEENRIVITDPNSKTEKCTYFFRP